MEFIINPSLLREELGLLTPVIERSAKIPVLSKIKLETNTASELQLTVTDLDVTMRVCRSTDVLQTGSILVEGKKLYEISRELPNEPIHFSINKSAQVEIRHKKGRHKLGTTDNAQFPEMPVAGTTRPGVTLPAAILREAIRRVSFAITTDQSRFTIAGAKLIVDETSLSMVATDGHRLAYVCFPLVNLNGQNLDLLVPKKSIVQLENLLDRLLRRDAECFIKISSGGGGGGGDQLCFEAGNYSLFSRQLAIGAFPNWRMVLPETLQYTAEISTEDFRQALSRVALAADNHNYTVTMEIESGRLLIKSKMSDGEAQEELLTVLASVDQQGREGVEESESAVHRVCFNCNYLIDFLQVVGKIGSPTFIFGFNDSNSPFELYLPNERQSYRFVLMPQRV